ncbi:unnamed protein product [Diamesa tonsa]
MTVSYMDDVATASKFGAFLKILFRWKGSIYKLIWFDLCVYLVSYYLLHLLYRFGLDDDGKHMFEIIAKYFNEHSTFIPLSFLLGFYVSTVMSRWWNQYTSIPWTTGIAVLVTSSLNGADARSRMMRRTIMRYTCLSLAMVFRTLSTQVRQRFPKMTDLIDAGLINEQELALLEDAEEELPGYSRNWLPIVWAAGIVTKAKEEKLIPHDFSVKIIIEKLDKFRSSCDDLMTYNSVSVPLVYTQVVTIAVYSHFLISLMGKQCIEGDGFKAGYVNLDLLPILMMLEFLFYMGWLKVAETLMNPFGEDDDDFEVNDMIVRNLQLSYQIVDKIRNQAPELTEDIFWNDSQKPANPSNDNKNKRQVVIKYEPKHDTAEYLSEREIFFIPSKSPSNLPAV